LFSSFSRWRNPPRFISRKETAAIFKLVPTCFGQITNPVQQLQQLAEQHYTNIQIVDEFSVEKSKLTEEISQFQQTVNLLKKENQKLKEEKSQQIQSIDIFVEENQSQNQSINGLIQEIQQLKEEKNKQLTSIEAFKR
jgi:uncharacterized protein involved in type VI secretion and phage assembly